jgi:hypothetical protein
MTQPARAADRVVIRPKQRAHSGSDAFLADIEQEPAALLATFELLLASLL